MNRRAGLADAAPGGLTVFISGGTRGIGRAIVQRLAPNASHIWVLGRDEEKFEQLRVSLATVAPRCSLHWLCASHADLEALRDALAAVFGHGSDPRPSLDLAVLNAGTYTEGDLLSMPLDDYRRDLDINLNAHLVTAREIVPSLVRGQLKRLVITGSTAAYEPYPLVPSYGVAKWGLRGLATNLREELRERRIGVTYFSPGGTLTDMWEGEDLPAGRLLEPDDIAKLIETLVTLSPQAVVEELILRPIEGDLHE